MNLSPITLTGQLAQLEPLAAEHLQAIQLAAADGELWQLFFTSVPPPDKTADWLKLALQMQETGMALPFIVRDLRTGKIVGTTRFCNIDSKNQRLEIGYTWYSQSVQRSGINTECKLLLLSHAFETLGCIAVEFRTDWLNKRSQAAIERLGAKRDGVLRNHMLQADGRIRDTVVYSIIQNEWPGVKANLRYFLQRGAAPRVEASPT